MCLGSSDLLSARARCAFLLDLHGLTYFSFPPGLLLRSELRDPSPRFFSFSCNTRVRTVPIITGNTPLATFFPMDVLIHPWMGDLPLLGFPLLLVGSVFSPFPPPRAPAQPPLPSAEGPSTCTSPASPHLRGPSFSHPRWWRLSPTHPRTCWDLFPQAVISHTDPAMLPTAHQKPPLPLQ